MFKARPATHRGSWYTHDASDLDVELSANLNRVPHVLEPMTSSSTGAPSSVPIPGARAIIAPHAGYSYSGPSAAWAYKALDWSKAKRVFILGPSHHLYLPKCAISTCDTYETPFGSLHLDLDVIKECYRTGLFKKLDDEHDNMEHSLEMHLPYIYKMLREAPLDQSSLPKIVPIVVGATTSATDRALGVFLAPYLSDPGNYFVISSDFCHWGKRFDYQYGLVQQQQSDPAKPLHEYISDVDHRCMQAIETGRYGEFESVLADTGNTVCGRHPILVMMAAVEEWRATTRGLGASANAGNFTFVRYERSSLVTKKHESSVSYCSAYAVF